MTRSLVLLVGAFAVHAIGVLAFWRTWEAAFGTNGRQIPPAWDIPLAYLILLLTACVATALTLWSIRARPSVALAAPQTLSLFLAANWGWSVLLFESIV